MNEVSEKPRKSLPLHTMVTLLCIVSGSLDAISFLALGEAFASVMTGNIVFIGLAAGTLNSRLALFCGVAIGGYAAGVLGGSWLAHRWTRELEEAIWPSGVTKVLCVQLGLLASVAVAWFYVGGEPSKQLEVLLLLPIACVMGLQSAAIRKIGVSVSSTYMTGALTALLEAIVTRRAFSPTESSAVGGLVALATGAVLASLLVTFLAPTAILVPVLALGSVIFIWIMHHHPRQEFGHERSTT